MRRTPLARCAGASAAAGAADFILSLRYADGPFSHQAALERQRAIRLRSPRS